MPIIQAMTISGRLIEKAKWEVNTLENVREGQVIQINIPVKEPNMIKYLSKTTDTVLDKDGKKYSVNLSVTITGFRHLYEPSQKQIQSMITVIPINRTVEQILVHLLDKNNSDPKFVAHIRNVLGN